MRRRHPAREFQKGLRARRKTRGYPLVGYKALNITLHLNHLVSRRTWVISMPSSQTSQPRPHAPSTGDSQLSSTKRTSCARVSMPNASRLPRYSSCGFPGSGFKITCSCEISERARLRDSALQPCRQRRLRRSLPCVQYKRVAGLRISAQKAGFTAPEPEPTSCFRMAINANSARRRSGEVRAYRSIARLGSGIGNYRSYFAGLVSLFPLRTPPAQRRSQPLNLTCVCRWRRLGFSP